MTIPHGKRSTAFWKLMDRVRETAREWGYTSRREMACFQNGYVKGFADGLTEPRCLAKKRKGKR